MKLNRDIRLALAAYFCHRNRQRKVIRQNHDADLNEAVCRMRSSSVQAAIRLPVPEWNKQADLEAIEAAAHRGGWKLQAIAGTFWFSQRTKSLKSIRTIEVHEDDYLDGHKPFVCAVDYNPNE